MSKINNFSNESDSYVEKNSSNLIPIVKQPQSIKYAKQLSSPSISHTTATSLNVKKSENQNENNKVQNSNYNRSISYLDDRNLKLAIIDYSDILKLIKLQNSIEYQEWLAFNSKISFLVLIVFPFFSNIYIFSKAKMYFDQINILYGAIAEQCTVKTCPTMSAPLNNQFFWFDEKGKKIKYSASQYIDTVLTYASKIFSDENLFPTETGRPFPAHFDSLVKKINKHLFQILAHMYHSHFSELLYLKLNTYVNSIYLHFYSFNKSFGILDEKEIEIMEDLNQCMIKKHFNSNDSPHHQFIHKQPPTIHQHTNEQNNSGTSGFSFFKKKLNFNLMA